MSRAPLRTLTVGLLAAALLAPAVAASAATPPTAPTAATSAVGDRFADLSWSGGTGTSALVRDVTGTAAPYTTTTGREVAVTSPTTAHDVGFANTGTATYAVWSLEADGTPSDAPLVTDVAAVPLVETQLTLATSAAAVPFGRAVTYTGTLTRTGGVPVADVPVELVATTVGGTDTRVVRRVQTGVDGVATTSLVPTRSTAFALRFAGNAFSSPSSSPDVVVQLLPKVTMALSAPAIKKGETVVLSGRVSPTLDGARLLVQRLVGGTWRNVTGLRVASTGTYRWVASPAIGVYTYRVLLPAQPAFLESASRAATLRVEARDLVSGNSGPDVVALKNLLRSLRYEPGAGTDSFTYDLVHAVMAFQKVERLPVTGKWTKAERTRAGRPTAFRLRYASPGRSVEVDITRQVLVIAEAGKVSKIVDVSTGTEKPYTYKGESDVAHTPRGRFSVYYKIDGVRVSKLGELYRPSYFIRGWAIHGSGSVPNYPASHGCVRITNGNTDRLYSLLAKGTPVSLYDA